jgi:hypothetical protein
MLGGSGFGPILREVFGGTLTQALGCEIVEVCVPR